VSATATLGGFTVDTFGLSAQDAFSNATSFLLGVDESTISITSISPVSKRRLSASSGSGSVAVNFDVTTTSQSASSSVSTGITGIAANPAAFVSALSTSLQAAGVNVNPTVAMSQPVISLNAPPVNMSSITNISAAAAGVSAQLSGLSGNDLANAQAALLGSLTSSNSSSAGSADVSNTAALVLAVLGTGNVSAAVQSSALSALGSLFSAGSSGGNLSSAASASLLNTMAVLTSGGAPLSASSVTNALSIMTAATSGAPLSAGSTDNAAAVMASVASSANLSDPSVANSVLGVLGSVATGTISLTGNASNNIIGALSSVASTSGPGVAPALTAVSNVLASLASSQASALLDNLATLAPGVLPQPLVVTSPSIQACVQVHVSDGSAPLELAPVPGSPSAFEPISASLLPIGTPAVAKFHSLAFDPYASANDTTTGSTRLEFAGPDGNALVVANASIPILFTLPHVPIVGDAQAACSWWDAAANNGTGAYATSGCIGVPSPQPPNHTLAFVPGYSTPDDVSLASSWTISGPLFPPAACQVQVLDCGSDLPCSGPVWGRNCTIYPNPRSPMLFPAVACPSGINTSLANGTALPAPVLRVVYGALCPLWQANALNCSWDNIKQSFTGDGCSPDPTNTTQCMCRHLTNFASASKPKVSLCSASDMGSLSASDIITKLRFLFIVVITLFGCMHAGAACGLAIDVSARAATMKRLCSPNTGFEMTPDGVWTWRVYQKEMEKHVDAPQGSAVELAEVLAFPFARLRVALPSELMPGSVAQCVGVRSGLSPAGLEESADELNSVMHTVSHGFRSLCGGEFRKRIPVLLPAGGNPDGKCIALDHRFAELELEGKHPAEEDKEERMVGTALILAHIANQRAISLVELGARTSAASKHFAGVRVPGIDHSFDDLCAMFMSMLGVDAGALIAGKSWLITARLWRFIFLQHTDGSWDASESLAFALGAHDGPLPPPNTSFMARLAAKLRKLDDLTEEEEDDNQFGGGSSISTGVDDAGVNDCPLTFQRKALLKHIPHELAALPDGERIWATLLGMTHLQKSPFSWLVSDPEEEDEPETTIVDAARTFIIARCRESAHLRRLFQSGTPQIAADKVLRRWQAAREYAIKRARAADAVAQHRVLHLAQRAVSRVVKACCTDHDTFAILFDSDSFVLRWQRFMILMTLLMAALLCAIIFYSSRGTVCCLEIREMLHSGAGQLCPGAANSTALLSPPPPFPPPFPPSSSPSMLALAGASASGCDPATPAGPCLGYLGSCGDLAAQFATLQGAYVYGLPGEQACQSNLADYVCHAFPDDENAIDQFIVSLIVSGPADSKTEPRLEADTLTPALQCIAIALPISMFLENLFISANEVEGAREGWLSFTGKWKILFGGKAVADWHWRDKTRTAPTELVRWLAAADAPYTSDVRLDACGATRLVH
jgi:hypothetical protein